MTLLHQNQKTDSQKSEVNIRQLWQNVLGIIEINVSPAHFATWFSQTTILENKNGKVIIGAPNGFVKEWLQNKYNKLIFKTLREISPDIKEVNYILYTPQNLNLDKIKIPKILLKTKKEQGQEIFEQMSLSQLNPETNLNSRYVFDNFIVGSFNELAHAASQAVAKNPGQDPYYNPLFIYGGVGLGKTHLAQAIGNEIVKTKSNKKIKYFTADQFSSELVSALHNGTIENFKKYYQEALDILIIDDIQFIAGKEKTQIEFFNVFNALYQKNKQVIISSDRPPKAIGTLEDRLRSRFEGGMVADIGYPDLETRIAILKSKLEERKITLPQEILEYLATHIQKNIREMEGALIKIIAWINFHHQIPAIPQVIEIFSQLIHQPKKITTYKKIIKAVVDFYDLCQEDLIRSSRKKEVVWPRQVAMYLLREDAGCSFSFIGNQLGGKDHTTVIYACEKVNKNLEINEILKQEITHIRERLYN